MALNIQAMLDKKEMSQRKLAEKMGINHVSINRYVNGKGNPTVSVLFKMAEVLQCHVTELFDSPGTSAEEHDLPKFCSHCGAEIIYPHMKG